MSKTNVNNSNIDPASITVLLPEGFALSNLSHYGELRKNPSNGSIEFVPCARPRTRKARVDATKNAPPSESEVEPVSRVPTAVKKRTPRAKTIEPPFSSVCAVNNNNTGNSSNNDNSTRKSASATIVSIAENGSHSSEQLTVVKAPTPSVRRPSPKKTPSAPSSASVGASTKPSPKRRNVIVKPKPKPKPPVSSIAGGGGGGGGGGLYSQLLREAEMYDGLEEIDPAFFFTDPSEDQQQQDARNEAFIDSFFVWNNKERVSVNSDVPNNNGKRSFVDLTTVNDDHADRAAPLRSNKRRKTIDDRDLLDTEEMRSAGECAICLMDMAGREMPYFTSCFHAFHRECIGAWYQLNPTCPMCKCGK